MMKRVLVVLLLSCAMPCLAVDLRNTAWYGSGTMTISLNGQSDSQPIDGVIAFIGNSPKKGLAAASDIPCKWTSKSVSSPAFTLIPLKSAAEQIAQGVRVELPGATVKVNPMPTQGTASLQAGTIAYSLRFKVSIKYLGTRFSGFATITQSGYRIAALSASDQRSELLPRVNKAIADALGR